MFPVKQEPSKKQPIFGLSTSPVKEIKSELQKEIERNMLKLEYERKEK